MALATPKLSPAEITARLASAGRKGDAKAYVLEFLSSNMPYAEVQPEADEFLSRETSEQKDVDGIVASIRSSLTAMKNSKNAPAGIDNIEVRKVTTADGPAVALFNKSANVATKSAE